MIVPGSTSPSGFTFVGERELYDGFVIRVLDGEFETPEGERIHRDVVRHPGAVGVVAIDNDAVVLVRQYRPALHADLLEIPAGKLDIAGEAPNVAAARELREEVGFEAGSLEWLTGMHCSVGFCDEYVHIFLATELSEVPVAYDGPEEEHMTVERIMLDDVEAALTDGQITDAKTMLGLHAALRRLGR